MNITNTKAGNCSDTKTASSSTKHLKVLFVASGNKKGAGVVNSFVQSQFDSLKAEGLDMTLFPVKGRGWRGYAKAVLELRRLVKQERPDIIHAHYSTCGFVASFATLCMRRKPKILVSILGSFPARDAKWYLVRFAIKCLWHQTLVKSERTRAQLGLDLPVIPNGVNLEIFRLKDHNEARKLVGFDLENEALEPAVLDAERTGIATSTQCAASNTKHAVSHKYIIWCSNPERVEKNWKLAEDAVHLLESEISDALRTESEGLSVELIAVYNKTPQEVCTYMNAADCLLLTSDSEGSPNVIKEAMACNCPIVTTDVGDVRERLANLDGCYVVEEPMAIDAEHLDAERLDSKNFDAWHTDAMRLEKTRRVVTALEKALEFGKRTDGRQRILEDGLTIELIAKKIIKLYECI